MISAGLASVLKVTSISYLSKNSARTRTLVRVLGRYDACVWECPLELYLCYRMDTFIPC